MLSRNVTIASALESRLPIALIGACGLLSVAAVVATLADPRWVFAAAGLSALTVVLVPLLRERRFDPFAPWSFVMLSVFVGCTLRGAAISLELVDSAEIDRFFLLGQSPAHFYWPFAAFLLGLAALTSGYLIRVKGTPSLGRPAWDAKRIRRMVIVCAIASIAATALYIDRTDGFTSGRGISRKRTTLTTLDTTSDPSYRGYQSLRTLARLAEYSFYLLFLYASSSRPRISPRLKLALAALFVVAAAIPFYASTRSPIAWLFICTAAIWYYSGRPRPWHGIAGLAICLLAVFTWMSALRPPPPRIQPELATAGPSEEPRETDVGSPSLPSGRAPAARTASAGRIDRLAVQTGQLARAVVRPIVISRSGLDLMKTANIIDAVPERLDLQYGATIARFVIAPIPRELWPTKPVIHSGPLLGALVFDTFGDDTSTGYKRTGIPPGLIGEMFWNFHVPGMIVGAFLAGFAMRWMYDRLRPMRGGSPIGNGLYVVGPMVFSFDAVSTSVGSSLMWLVVNTTMLWALMWVVRVPRTSLTDRSARQLHAPSLNPGS